MNPSRGKEKFSDALLLGSGCMCHMCLRKEWFNTYEDFERGTVLIGNNAACKTVGIGSIHMKMFDGQVRTLKDVRHVSDPRKNLLVGSLESLGIQVLGYGWNSKGH